MKRQQRLLAMLVALQERHRTTAAELAGEFGVSERTVLRDVQALADADVPVFAERGRFGGIVLLPGTQIDLARMTQAEAEILNVVGVDLDTARRLGVDAAARSALRKLAARRSSRPSPANDAPQLDFAEVVAIDHRGWFAPPDDTDVASLVRDLRLGRRLRVDYRRSGRDRAESTVVDPYGVVLRADRWYLVADADGSPRLFALSRLQGWEVLDRPRRLRPGTDLAGVAAALAAALETDRQVTVTADLDADRLDMARRILGSRLIGTEATESQGTVRISVAYEQIGAVRHLLQFADHIRVVDPPEARRLVRELATTIAERHAEP